MIADPNEPAFATSDNGNEHTTTWQGQKGLTKREYFAGQALTGLAANQAVIISLQNKGYKNEQMNEVLANTSVSIADFLIKALNN